MFSQGFFNSCWVISRTFDVEDSFKSTLMIVHLPVASAITRITLNYTCDVLDRTSEPIWTKHVKGSYIVYIKT